MRVKSSETSGFPLLLEPAELQGMLGDTNVVVVDLSMLSVYSSGHIPGALWLSYPSILHQHDDVDCDVPPAEKLSETLSQLGVKPEHHVVAYDSQGCPMAARLLWTLDEIGHKNFSMLNGGLASWKQAGFELEMEKRVLPPSDYAVELSGRCNILRDEIEGKLHNENMLLIDCRTEEEFANELVITDRGGYVPGAVHYDWMRAMDEENASRMQPEDKLRIQMQSLGVDHDREVVVYCQTHMRSAYIYIMLKTLGFTNIRGYAAGYSEWGNALDTPIDNALDEQVEAASVAVPNESKPKLALVKSSSDELPSINTKLLPLGEALLKHAATNMAGVNALVQENQARRPFQGLRISGCLKLTPGIGFLIKSMVDLGASVRWADVEADENGNNVATYLLSQRIPVFALSASGSEQGNVEGAVQKALVFPGDRMPQVLIDDSDESCMPSIRENLAGIETEVPTFSLDEIHDELNDGNRKLLVEMMLLAKWELRACDDLYDLHIWAANPMVCHCHSVVLLKNTLCACA